jgi:phospholipase C
MRNENIALFNRGFLFDLLEQYWQAVSDEIRREAKPQILNVNESQYLEHILSKYHLDVPEIIDAGIRVESNGESLIKATYEAVRNSPLWSGSMIIITWDEHGGFYDHVPPPSAVAPGDTVPGGDYNQYGFTFQQYGPRVPAVIISPLIAKNLIDHRVYDHASIPATLEVCFGLSSMTQRDANANNLMPLVSLPNPRGDTPAALKTPAQSGVGGCDPVSFERRVATTASSGAEEIPVTRPNDFINEGNMPGFLFVALRSDLALSAPEEKAAIVARFKRIQTRAEGNQYMEEVRVKLRAARNV